MVKSEDSGVYVLKTIACFLVINVHYTIGGQLIPF
ncbi:hypothetical protein OM7_03305 [Enterococcus faecium EnGen0046]|nr:hypothetical protein OM7_03305 [Enterococcus faecium EnGen0046]OTO86630.1 hypothetical protein A5847_001019 [Enterococcus faecium]